MLNFRTPSTATDFATVAIAGVKYIWLCFNSGNDARIANAKRLGILLLSPGLIGGGEYTCFLNGNENACTPECLCGMHRSRL